MIPLASKQHALVNGVALEEYKNTVTLPVSSLGREWFKQDFDLLFLQHSQELFFNKYSSNFHHRKVNLAVCRILLDVLICASEASLHPPKYSGLISNYSLN